MAEREGKSRRGFASMDPQRQREIASKGGRAAHAKGTAHEFDSDEARRAGRKGGEVVSRNRDHMAEIGRRGGEARGENRASSRGERGEDAARGDGRERVSRDSMGREGIEREAPLRGGNGSAGIPTGTARGETMDRDRHPAQPDERTRESGSR
ncbi:MAG TPA: KGG domain-containing protein [Gemmatimonadaceae bacterium]|nr:KGG domain-containing protein [Gemmatimonadaceae bacterium]